MVSLHPLLQVNKVGVSAFNWLEDKREGFAFLGALFLIGANLEVARCGESVEDGILLHYMIF